MADPNPLIDYVYQTAIENHLREYRGRSIYLERGMYLEPDIDLFRSMYSEMSDSSGNPLHNRHINLYSQGRLTTEWVKCQNKLPVRIPSKIYYFYDEIPPNGFVSTDEVTDDMRDFAIYMYFTKKRDAVTSRNFLSLCHKISQHQYVSDIEICNLDCDNANEINCFKVSKHCKSIQVKNCGIPSQVLVHLQQQICHCCELQILSFHGTRIENPLFLNNLKQMASLTHLGLGRTGIDSETCEKVCKQLKYLKHLKNINLSSCPLGLHGMYLVEAIDCWGSHPPLEELSLSGCNMPKRVCSQLLSKLSRCEHLVHLNLQGNFLTGCLPNFLPDVHPGLRKLKVVVIDECQVNKDDLCHLTKLIRQSKLPLLKHISARNNNLCKMEDELEELISACVKLYSSSGVINLRVNENKLSSQTCKRIQQLCVGTKIFLDL